MLRDMGLRGALRIATGLLGATALLLAPATVHADGAGLVAQWHLDEITGGATPDSSGNGLTGDEVSGTLVPGRFGSALSTPNNNDGFRVPANPLLEPQRITVMAWAKKGAPLNVFRTIVSKGSQACGTHESYALDTGPDGGLRFFAYQGGSAVAAVASAVAPASIWNNQWHAVAGTFDGTTARLYVDGVQVGSAPAAVPGGGIAYGLPESRLSVSRFPEDGACDPNGFQFRGAIDEVRLYNRALTAAEITYLQNPNATTPPNLPIPGGGGGGVPAPAADPHDRRRSTLPLPGDLGARRCGLLQLVEAERYHLSRPEHGRGDHSEREGGERPKSGDPPWRARLAVSLPDQHGGAGRIESHRGAQRHPEGSADRAEGRVRQL